MAASFGRGRPPSVRQKQELAAMGRSYGAGPLRR